jgi:hypothetical protein
VKIRAIRGQNSNEDPCNFGIRVKPRMNADEKESKSGNGFILNPRSSVVDSSHLASGLLLCEKPD